MSEPYIGEIRILPYTFNPVNWKRCDGQLLEIGQFTALFAVIGINYGGDGRRTFALPNLKQRTPRGIGRGPGLTACRIGENSGVTGLSLTYNQIPSHTHSAIAIKKGSDSVAGTDMQLGRSKAGTDTYSHSPDMTAQTKLSEDFLHVAGNSSPHENRQPFTAVYYCICHEGVFPSRQ